MALVLQIALGIILAVVLLPVLVALFVALIDLLGSSSGRAAPEPRQLKSVATSGAVKPEGIGPVQLRFGAWEFRRAVKTDDEFVERFISRAPSNLVEQVRVDVVPRLRGAGSVPVVQQLVVSGDWVFVQGEIQFEGAKANLDGWHLVGLAPGGAPQESSIAERPDLASSLGRRLGRLLRAVRQRS